MSNTRRPTTARKHTPRSTSERKKAMDEGLSIKFEGKTYTVRIGDLSAMDSAALRRETGLSFTGIMRSMTTDPDIDLIAAVVWLARRIDGEKLLAYEDVASEIGYDADIDLLDAEADEDPET